MSTTLEKYLHEQAAKKAEGKALIDEWLPAVDALFADIKKWIKECDPEGVIDVEVAGHNVNEPGIGSYRAPRLNLNFLGKWIGIIPRARRIMGIPKPPQKSGPPFAEGRVDISDDVRRFFLYRFRREDGSDEWYVESPTNLLANLGAAPLPPKLLDKETFQNALLSYLL